MKSLIDHARSFAEHVAERAAEFHSLADGQSPEVLFITCSDSRVIPSLITGARPGELFELRTAGNIVPRYSKDRPSGEAATIEYALRVLNVCDVVVCGHSHCGAVGALVRGDDLSSAPAVRGWLEHSVPQLHGTPAMYGARDGGTEGTPDLPAAVQRHAVAQLATLSAYPGISERLAAGTLSLHAWYYEVHTGAILAHRPGRGGEFGPL